MITTSHRNSRLLQQAVTHVALGLGAVFMLLPFWLMLRTSFTPPEEIFRGNLLSLPSFTLENYGRVFAEVLSTAV